MENGKTVCSTFNVLDSIRQKCCQNCRFLARNEKMMYICTRKNKYIIGTDEHVCEWFEEFHS